MIKNKRRNTYLSRHHLIPKSRNGKLVPSNTLRLWRDSHNWWHNIFHNRTLSEILGFLHSNSNELKRKYESHSWKKLFGNKTIREVIVILKRIKRIKSKL